MDKWDRRFLNLAREVSTWSKDEGTKVGSVITKGKERPIVGYNGFPQGVEDTAERLTDYHLKHKLVVHAEANALLSAHRDLTGHTLYCNYPPCIRCTVLIIRTGITRVVTLQSSAEKMAKHHVDIELSKAVFTEAGIIYDIFKYAELIDERAVS